MSTLTPSHLSSLGQKGPWSSDLATTASPELQSALQECLAGLPEILRERISAALADRYEASWARTLLGALALAGDSGYQAVGLLDDGLVEMKGEGLPTFVMAVLSFEGDARPAGRPEDIERLTEALETTFGDRRYALYLRRRVPQQFDPAPVSRAVHLWLQAIDRGEWSGRHAIYEDEDVAIELTLLDERGGTERSRILTVGPLDSLERLARVDAQIVEVSRAHFDARRELPMVIVLGCDSAWRMPRGYAEQLLYGTADWTMSDSNGYRACFQENGRSLFCDPTCRELAALWWIQPAEGWGFESRVHENPWCDVEAPTVMGSRFARVGEDFHHPERPVQGWVDGLWTTWGMPS